MEPGVSLFRGTTYFNSSTAAKVLDRNEEYLCFCLFLVKSPFSDILSGCREFYYTSFMLLLRCLYVKYYCLAIYLYYIILTWIFVLVVGVFPLCGALRSPA